MQEKEYIIFGFGLSGIGCALTLLNAGKKIRIFELDYDYPMRGYFFIGPTRLNPVWMKGGHFDTLCINELRKYKIEREFIHDQNTLLNLGLWVDEEKYEVKDQFSDKHIILASSGKIAPIPDSVKYSEDSWKGISLDTWSDAFFVKGKKAVIVGYGDWMINQYLMARANDVNPLIISEKEQLSGQDFLIEKLNAFDDLNIIFNSKVTQILSEKDGEVYSIEYNHDGNLHQMDCSVVFWANELEKNYFPLTKSFVKELGDSGRLTVTGMLRGVPYFDHLALFEDGIQVANNI